MVNWNILFEKLNIDENSVVLEKTSIKNDNILKHLSGAMIPKTHIYIRSDVDDRFKEYIQAHELCHHYLIFNLGYYFYYNEEETKDPLCSLIMSFSHHFTIDNILKRCGFNVKEWHYKQYQNCKRSALNGFTSNLDAVGKSLNLIESDFWLENDCINKLKNLFIKHCDSCADVFKFATTDFSKLKDNDKIFEAEGSMEILKSLHNALNLPPAQMYCMKVYKEDI
ncbi:MAG: hypothetical protein FH758_01305 [Firmicutes bacterium]|nr:hypothetical protein [Bacillota bacterium]